MNMPREPQGRAQRPKVFGDGASGWALVAFACLGCGTAESVTVDDHQTPEIVARANVCPEFGWWLLLPKSLRIGETTDILVNVSDPDSPRAKLTFDWAATTGSFSELHRADTTYTCRRVGHQALTLDARDDLDCRSVLELDVTCLDP